MKWFFIFCIGFLYLNVAYSQQVQLEFTIIDANTKVPISNAHVFVNNTSSGTTSDNIGLCQLMVSASESQELIITHLLYDPLILSPDKYLGFPEGTVLEMKGNAFDIDEILLVAERGKGWNRKYKRFKKTLLGNDKAASSCVILNPEVLRFEDLQGALRVTAVDLLNIQNNYLGYDIEFLLDELIIGQDGSSYFKGNSRFIDKKSNNRRKFKKRREKEYSRSVEHFLLSLVASSDPKTLLKYGYTLEIDKYQQNGFYTFMQPSDLNVFTSPDSIDGRYRLYFPHFLSISHAGLKVKADEVVQVSVSGAEQQKFGSGRTQSLNKDLADQKSRLFKVEPFLLFDSRGNIINKSAVREYGYWANKRLASALPIDYKEASEPNKMIQDSNVAVVDTLQIFKDLISNNSYLKKEALTFIQNHWSPTYVPPLLDIVRLNQDYELQFTLKNILNKHLPSIDANYHNGLEWIWSKESMYGSYYPDFKAYIYQYLDSSFKTYFKGRASESNIRFDEIVWGGVMQDGIPPLRSPKMIDAEEADYMGDYDIVFGLELNGEVRAYPKRILAWHEFLTEDIGDSSIAVVYCTLCGTVIAYNTEHQGTKHTIGTSGFLYRSNKLMYDKATQSLWSTMLGEPVVGPLINQGIKLDILAIETTTWKEWKERHPETKVLSLQTGHERNYDEGEAYKEYFATDNLMFPVPQNDTRLANKARVFIPRIEGSDSDPLAISVRYLKRKRIYQDKIGNTNIIIITEKNGSSRAYKSDNQVFKSYKKGQLIDSKDQEWLVREDMLVGPESQQLSRIPAHETFWFAWFNVFLETRLVK